MAEHKHIRATDADIRHVNQNYCYNAKATTTTTKSMLLMETQDECDRNSMRDSMSMNTINEQQCNCCSMNTPAQKRINETSLSVITSYADPESNEHVVNTISAITPTTTCNAAVKTINDNASFDRVNDATTPSSVPVTPSPMTSPEAIEALLRREAKYCRSLSISSDAVTEFSKTTAKTTTKRTNYISWDDYFMAIAIVSSYRSKDPVHPTGACIVDPSNHIIGTGYNGFPTNCSDDVLPWTSCQPPEVTTTSETQLTSETKQDSIGTQELQQQERWLHTPSPYMVHAEVNAILNKCSHNCDNARIYTQHFPCHECAKVIIQSRIQEIVYLYDNHSDTDSVRASRIMLSMTGIRTRQHQPKTHILHLNFYKALNDEERVLQDQEPERTRNRGQEKQINDVTASSSVADRTRSKNLEHRDLMFREAQYDALLFGSTKRQNYLSWDDYFMTMAFLTAQRSKDPNTQVGACIVDINKRIVGLGYNGFPIGCSDDYLPWSRGDDASKTTASETTSTMSELHKKYVYVVHAEVNAILNKGSADVRGGTLYVALFPCNDCSKVIIQAGIREVVYMSDRYHHTDSCKASRILLQMAGVQLRKYIPTVSSISIDMKIR